MIKQETKKVKKGINKKLLIPLSVVFVIGLVAALTYYAVFSATINFTQPIVTEGNPSSSVDFVVGEYVALGNPITVSNTGATEKIVVISNDNENLDVTVSYTGELTLAKKDLTSWVSTGVTKEITYTMVGDTFKVSGVPTGYTLVYYKDNTGYVYTGEVVTAITMNLPVAGDENAINDSMLDYCNNGFNPGATQCVGAKLWLVPVGAVTSNVIDWSQASSFYFETALIQFNSARNIVISPHSSVTFTPMFEVDEHSSTITDLVVTTKVA